MESQWFASVPNSDAVGTPPRQGHALDHERDAGRLGVLVQGRGYARLEGRETCDGPVGKQCKVPPSETVSDGHENGGTLFLRTAPLLEPVAPTPSGPDRPRETAVKLRARVHRLLQLPREVLPERSHLSEQRA